MVCRLILKLFFIIAAFFLATPYVPLYAEERTVKVGVYDNAPIVFQGEDGNFQGFSVEVLDYIASKENWDLKYVLGTWPECLARLEKGDIDIQVYIAYSKERANKYDFTNELLLSNWGIIYTWPGSGIETLLDLEGKTVALLTNSIHSTAIKKIIKDFGINLTILDIDNHHSGFKLVEEKKAEAVVVNRVFGLTNAKKYNVERTHIIFNPIEIRYAMPKDKNHELGIAIDKHLKLLKADKTSIFYQSFNKAFDFTGNFVPDWVKWALLAVVGMFCLLFSISFFLKRQVKNRTRELEVEISERKKTENLLIKSEERYALAQSAANIGSWDWDILSGNLQWSGKVFSIFGIDSTKVEITYEIFLQCIHPEDRQFVENSFRISIEEDEGYALDHRIVLPNGTIRWVSERGDIFHDNDKKPVRMLGIVQDISDRKHVEEELKKYRENLEELVKERTNELERKTENLEESRKALTYLLEDVNIARNELEKVNNEYDAANRELKEFAYIVSHDLKAPLRAIGQLSHWIAEDYSDSFDADGKEQMDLILQRVKRMDGLIDGVLQYSRVGRIKEKEEPLDLNIFVKEVIDDIAPPDTVQILFDSKLPVVLRDPTRMGQVFQNLIGNAVKYMDKDEGLVKVGCADEDAYWEFSVSDNGPGIDERYHDKIFQIFQTLTPRDERESTGIGLTLVKKIVTLYGGSIWVESKTGHGTTFFFTLAKQGEDNEKL